MARTVVLAYVVREDVMKADESTVLREISEACASDWRTEIRYKKVREVLEKYNVPYLVKEFEGVHPSDYLRELTERDFCYAKKNAIPNLHIGEVRSLVFIIPDYEHDPPEPEPETSKNNQPISTEIDRLLLLKELISKFLR